MAPYRLNAFITIKKREVERKLKTGELKTYFFEESYIRIKDHEFKQNQNVVIIDSDEYSKQIHDLEDEVRVKVDGFAKREEKLIKKYEKEKEDLIKTHNVFENQYRSQEARLKKSFDEINILEERVRELEGRGLIDYFKRRIKRPALNK